ncbi:MAG: hypothetical protein LC122_02590 [Chitinophagales bacterium]|nr:hypothetical protein [Chitinophagales bacterium]
MSKKYDYDFSIVENKKENFYYLLGVLLTDGNLKFNKKRNCYQMKISSIDKQWLELIKNKLNGGGLYKYKENCWELSISNSKIINHFIEFGLKENKSLNLRCPQINELFVKDFLRGVFDGDGHISSEKIKFHKMCSGVSSGSELFIKDLYDLILKNFNIKGNISKYNTIPHFIGERFCNTVSTIYSIKFSATNTAKLCSIIYDNCDLFLDRKKSNADFIVDIYKKKIQEKKDKNQERLDFIFSNVNILDTRQMESKLKMCRKQIIKILKTKYYFDNSSKLWIKASVD